MREHRRIPQPNADIGDLHLTGFSLQLFNESRTNAGYSLLHDSGCSHVWGFGGLSRAALHGPRLMGDPPCTKVGTEAVFL